MTDHDKGYECGLDRKKLTTREVDSLGIKNITEFVNGMIDGFEDGIWDILSEINDDWKLKIFKRSK